MLRAELPPVEPDMLPCSFGDVIYDIFVELFHNQASWVSKPQVQRGFQALLGGLLDR